MPNSIHEECVNVINSALIEILLFYFQEDSEHIDEWEKEFSEACENLIKEIADTIRHRED